MTTPNTTAAAVQWAPDRRYGVPGLRERMLSPESHRRSVRAGRRSPPEQDRRIGSANTNPRPRSFIASVLCGPVAVSVLGCQARASRMMFRGVSVARRKCE